MEFVAVFVFGAIIGSFLNVCIYRLPRNMSVVKPRSLCPNCASQIMWFDNIPLISYLVLKGRCRRCGDKIPLRYFLVELVTAVSGVLLLANFSFTGTFFVYWLFTCILIVIVFIDIGHKIIPDILSITGIILGLVFVPLFSKRADITYLKALAASFAGVLAGGGSMFLLGFLGELVFRKEAVGGGDVKLMGMIGAFLGWKLVLLSFFIAPIFGSVVGLYAKLIKGENIIPYAPFLALGAIVSLFFGNDILNYLLYGL